LPATLAEAVPAPADPLRPTAALTDAGPDAAELPPLPPLTPEEIAILAPPPEPVAEPAAEPVAEPAPEPGVLPEPILDAQPLPAGDATSEPLPMPEQTAILRPVPALETQALDVTANRLPRIGDAEAAPPAETALPDEDQTALQRFARAFENPSAKPMFALILIDTGGPDVDRTGLASLPFPVSFAIDPAARDAATAAAIYRAADQEVIMLATGIPQGATASDLAVSFQANAAALPESVAVLDLEEGGFQTNRPLATEVVPVIKDIGRGLITWDKGLNAGDQVARREGLAACMVFRRLDGAGESVPTMRRYLDRAAFKAAQDGRVTVVGTTNPDTVKALLEWTVEGRAASVALAPISAVLATP
ncbi:divergent polysaccharide deacetylase family protein, partial [Rhodobacter ferrooxidans]|uniref:divergent polysaccharide deacetylase family protein n=1 Tax=Rhodobacter ferrooxidans TaxID=371731 RepID=UPI000594EBB0